MSRSISIRPARLADMPAVGRMQHACWMAAYPGVLDAAFLGQLSPEGMALRLAQHFDAATGAPVLDRSIFLLAAPEAQPGRVVGMVRGGPTRARTAGGDPVPPEVCVRFPYELMAIHVDPGNQRAGVGRGLFGAFARAVQACGGDSLVLWVLSANQRARAFYECLGGKPAGEGWLTLGGKAYPQIAYGWEHLGDWD